MIMTMMITMTMTNIKKERKGIDFMKKFELAKKDKELLAGLLKSTQSALLELLPTHLRELFGEKNVISCDKYIVAIGDSPVGLVAHLDTVHKTPVVTLLHDPEANIMWSPEGIGADDRAGVFSILKLLEMGHRPTVIFTTDEEIGAIGAAALIKDLVSSPTELKFLVELDRRGSKDCVFYDCANDEFDKYIESFGFESAFGSFSDICEICPQWEIAGVNLSIGYYNEHSNREILNLKEMFDTIDKVEKIIVDAPNDSVPVFEFIEDTRFSKYGAAYGGNYYTQQFDLYEEGEAHESELDWYKDELNYRNRNSYDSSKGLCHNCLITIDKDLLVTLGDGTYCGDCLPICTTDCTRCGKLFYNPRKEDVICQDCKDGVY